MAGGGGLVGGGESARPGEVAAPLRTEVLRVSGATKTFVAQTVLHGVDLTVCAGEVHALVGQNGSGKSTLIKILAGYHRPDPGATAAVDGVEFELGEPGVAQAAGVRFVHQDLGLVGGLSTVENLAMGRSWRTGRLGRILWREEAACARASLAVLGLDFDVQAPVDSLSLAQRTGVAITRAVPEDGIGAKVLVLDEPTAALPGGDTERLFDVMRRLRDRGLGIVFVSHQLDEVLEIGDRVSALRNGRLVAEDVACNELDHAALVELVVGHELVPDEERPPARPRRDGGEPTLRVNGLCAGDVERFDVEVFPGEIVGVAGLTGSGRDSIGGLLGGRLPYQGTVAVAGRPLEPASPHAALEAKAALLPGDRGALGTVAALTMRENMTLSSLRRHTRAVWLDRRSERVEVRAWIDRLGIVTDGTEAEMQTLSGGNQQKVLLARVLRLEPSLLILDEPTTGVDIGTRSDVHEIVEAAAEEGTAVIVMSSDSGELVRLSDRVCVMWRGRISKTFTRGVDLDVARLDHAQLGAGYE